MHETSSSSLTSNVASSPNVKSAAALLKILGNEHRLTILCHLKGEEKSVGALEKELPLSQSALSQHLAKLRAQGLVEYRKQGTTVFYKVKNPVVEAMLQTLSKFYSCGEEV